MNTKDVGILAESAILHKFVSLGYTVCLPYGDNAPYDLVVNTPTGMYKVQVKLAHVSNGVISATTTFRTGANRRGYGTYAGLVDYIAVYCYETGTCYAIKAEECGSCLNLRIKAPANNQSAKIRYADDYLLERVIL